MDRENVGILFFYYQLLLSETLQVNRVKIIRHFDRLLFFTMHMYTCIYIYIYIMGTILATPISVYKLCIKSGY